MYAVVRRIGFVPGAPARGATELETFRQVHEQQPGFIGSLDIDEGDGRHVIVNLWNSAAAADAGRQAVGPVAVRTMQPLTTEPPELLAVGEVSTALSVRHPD